MRSARRRSPAERASPAPVERRGRVASAGRPFSDSASNLLCRPTAGLDDVVKGQQEEDGSHRRPDLVRLHRRLAGHGIGYDVRDFGTPPRRCQLPERDWIQVCHDSSQTDRLCAYPATAEVNRASDLGVQSRRDLGDLRVRALDCSARAHLARGAPARAARDAQLLVELAPVRERGSCVLIDAHTAAGDVGSALAAYERCRIAPKGRARRRSLTDDPRPPRRAVARAG
jgi:Bacterial transcriptional activator domain